MSEAARIKKLCEEKWVCPGVANPAHLNAWKKILRVPPLFGEHILDLQPEPGRRAIPKVKRRRNTKRKLHNGSRQCP